MSGSTQLQRRGTRVAVERFEVSQRQRLIAAMAQVAAEQGRRAASVELVCERAGMSRRTFYEHFTDGEQCFVSAVGQAFDQLFAAIDLAVGAEAQDWEDRACTTVAALIATLDRDRTLARLCVIEPHSGSPVALSIRHAAVHRLALVLAAGATVGDALRDAAARGAIGAILELATDPILADESLQPIVAPALYSALAPFTGRRVASLRAADPAIGVRHESQMSRHLVRLERVGIVEHHKEGRANAWRLTAKGCETAAHLRSTSRRSANTTMKGLV
jgi:AcrR family transcriptional regulator